MAPVDEFKAIKARVTECLILASAHFGQTFPAIPVKFDLTGKVGGSYCYRYDRRSGKTTHFFRFNRVLIRENLDEYLDQICPHEVAHYVARMIWGRGISAHGPEWKSVMTDVFKLAPDRCHSMDTTNAAKRHYVYKCSCREHQLTKAIHNKILRGHSYKCKPCGGTLTFKEELASSSTRIITKLFVGTAGAPIEEAEIKKISAMTLDHQVLELVIDSMVVAEKQVIKLGKTLKVAPTAVARHANPDTLPGGVSHAILFGDVLPERQARVAKAFEQRGVKVRMIRSGVG